LTRTDLIKALKFVQHAAGKKDVRYFLNGVLFEFTATGLTLVATDGHRLACIELEQNTVCGDLQVITTNDEVKRLLQMLDCQRDELVEFYPGDKGLICSNGWAADGIDGQYPNWRRTIPRNKEATAQIGLQAGYLEEAGKAFKALHKGERYASAVMHLHGENMSVKLTSGHPSAFILIMPVKI